MNSLTHIQSSNSSKFLRPVISSLLQTTGLRGALMIPTLYLTGDLKASASGSTALALTRSFQAVPHMGKIHDLTTSINMIDDRLDSSSPDWVIKAGEPHLGIVPSPIFLSDDSCPREFTHAFNTVVRHGLTRRDVGVAFNNVLAVHIRNHAECDARFRSSPTLENRQALHNAKVQMTETYTIFIFRCMTIAKTIPANLDTFSPKDATEHMPEIAHLAGILQLFDDIRDILIDLEMEVLQGVPSSNWLAIKMSENGDYTTGDDRDDAVRAYVRKRSGTHEEDNTPPAFITRALNQSVIEIESKISLLNSPMARTILSTALEILVQSGLKSSFHPAMLEKDLKRQAEISAIKRKFANHPNCHI